MFDESLKIECKRGQYKVGDTIKINDREWIVTEICFNGITDTAVFRTLADVVLHSSHVILADDNRPILLSDLLYNIIEEGRRRQYQ